MPTEIVTLRIGGASYKVRSGASKEKLEELADVVSEKLDEIPGSGTDARRVVLAALALAYELGIERDKRVRLEEQTRELLVRAIGRLDIVLGDPGTVEHVSRET